MTITAALCNYNGSAHLAEAIESVLDQQRAADEVLLIDDGSRDDSVAIMKGFAQRHPRVRVIEHEQNLGQAGGFNTAVRESACDCIAFIDSDDTWKPHKLGTCLDTIAKTPKFSLLHHGMALRHGQEYSDELIVPMLFEGDCAEIARLTNDLLVFAPTSGLVFAREVLQKVCPMPLDFRICADGYLTRTAFCHGPVLMVREPLGYYRVHGSNATAGNSRFKKARYKREVLIPALDRYYQENGFAQRYEESKNLRERIFTTTLSDIITYLRRHVPGWRYRL